MNIFKKVVSSFVLLTLVGLSACESGGDESPSNRLQGTWSAVSFEADVTVVLDAQGTELTSTSRMRGSNLDYDITFTETEFMTSGSYTIDNAFTFNGLTQQVSTNISNISGSGTYRATINQIFFSDSFYGLEVDGQALSMGGEEQTAAYEINGDGQLVISQNQTVTVEQSGLTTSTTIVGTSVWERQ